MTLSHEDKANAVYVLPADGIDPELLEPTQEDKDFEAFKAEMYDSDSYAKLTVSRQPVDSRNRPMGKKLFQCFECGIDDYTFSQLCTRIREDFGTGLYKIQGRNSKGHFKFGKTIGVEAPKDAETKETNGMNAGALIDKFSDAMERQQMRTEEMFRNMAGPQTGGDAFDQMTKMMAAMGSMMSGMGINPQAPEPRKTLIEQLTEFKMLKELMSDGNSDDSGDANLYTLLGKTVEAFGGPIAAAIAQGSQSGQLDESGVAMQRALPAPNPTTSDKTAKADSMSEQEQHNMAMRKNIHILIQNAKTGIPPDSFANILVNNTPEDKQDEFWEFISAENCVDTIITLEPAADAYRDWFEKLRLAVIDLMADPQVGEPDAGDPEIHKEDAAINTAQENERLQAEADVSNIANVGKLPTVAGTELSENAASDSDATLDT